ncbi:MAG: copper chaperone PCu(A)C [Hydrogenobacter thermophilus]|uniref:copper chaperone PCu(A)C n=1 Tax=Hydrogenobacter thermophilus TaxID=940 RepID=UPI001C771AA2|nr:copper chaperone PCu(A)C [Hydrogenobacter thermophilus]QWK19193.1 MAG: copper chaperone PCu(A)C [Hydrogenobacter thermophilus]
MRKLLFAVGLSGIALATPKIEVKDAWVREVPQVSTMSAAYMVIENKGDQADKLVGASTNIAKVVELHETVGGKMRRIKALEIPPGKSVELKPGGYHLMLINLTEKPKEGQKVEITLKFEKSGDVKVQANVKKAEGH